MWEGLTPPYATIVADPPWETRGTGRAFGLQGMADVRPESFMDIVERSSPAPRVELFCRRPRFGWDSWGLGYEGMAS